ncbi:MAG: PIG-L family deacetylase [Chloracidobacterium sp.]|nr:PIG-L family deacetylase [Chloracidobacterium sp.]
MRIRITINALRTALVVAVLSQLLLPVHTQAQVRPVNDYGAIGLAQLLKRLNTTASVMMIGAHPDDEDSALIAYLARGENARTAYLSLTRGDGGQNIIGPELFESLGVIRTEELLQARRLDGAEQYFARAFDYGFSKTLDEAKSKWPQDVILCDVVRAIRSFRPLVVISRFSGTSADGHGQHQYAGFISPLAVKAAADPQQCTQSGEPWKVLKFYAGQGFSAGSTATLRLNTGAYDAALGRSYFEIAMEGRSQHKSQGEGRLELKGDLFSGLNLKENSVTGNAPELSPFSGIDISITGIPAITNNSEEPVKKKATELQAKIEAVTAKFQPLGKSAMLSDLVAAYKLAVECEWSTRQPRTKTMFRVVEANLAALIANAAGNSDRRTG